MYSTKLLMVLLATFAATVLGAPVKDKQDEKITVAPTEVLGDFDVHGDNMDNAKLPLEDCKAIHDEDKSKPTGIYTVVTDELRKFDVFCDMTLNGGGWTLIMRRKNDSVDFSRNWNAYKNGFGDLNGNFWIGLENIHALTKPSRGQFELWVGLRSHGNVFPPVKAEDLYRFAHYKSFKVGDASSFYQLTISGYDSSFSTAGDSLSHHDDAAFSTPDRDHDGAHDLSCAGKYKSGWWFRNCLDSNLSGKWWTPQSPNNGQLGGIIWETFKGETYSLKSVVMAIRRVPSK